VATWGPQPTRARLGLLARPGGLCPPGAPPSEVICTKNSEKIALNFQGILRTFIFGSFFIAQEIQKTDKAWHLFYLTKKNRKQKLGAEGCAY
jgi:hypothetical protein